MRTPSAWRETPDAQRVALRRLVIILHTLNDGFWILSHCHIVASARNIVSARRGERGGRDNSTTELLYIIIYNNFKLLLFLFFSIIFYYFYSSIISISSIFFYFYCYSSYFSSIISIFLPIIILLKPWTSSSLPPRGSWWGAGGCLELVGASRNNAPMWQCDKVTFLVKSRLSLEAIDGMATDIVR